MLKVKERIKYYTDKDYFKIGGVTRIQTVRKINGLIYSGSFVLIVIIIFYIILNISTNYYKLDNFEDYIEEYNEGKHPIKFNKINLGIKIMPSYNFEKNILFMRQSTNYKKSIIHEGTSLAESYEINSTFFRTNKTRKVFPKFSFKPEYVPLGNSIDLCIAAHWGEIERGKHYDIMKPVEGFPKCTSANAKFIWNREDSTNGINVPAWKQTMNEADCNYEDCPNYCKENYEGIYVKGVNKNVCYSYEILHEICFVIKYDPLKDEYAFHGGCFYDNKTYTMVPAKVGEEVNFNNVEIEIREFSDPIVQAGELTDYNFNFGHMWRFVSFVLKIVALISLGVLGYAAYEVHKIKEKFRGAPNLIGGEEGAGMPGGFAI